jgi:hypothetical protein
MDTVLLVENKDPAASAAHKTDNGSKSQQSELETSVAEFLSNSGVRTPETFCVTVMRLKEHELKK